MLLEDSQQSFMVGGQLVRGSWVKCTYVLAKLGDKPARSLVPSGLDDQLQTEPGKQTLGRIQNQSDHTGSPRRPMMWLRGQPGSSQTSGHPSGGAVCQNQASFLHHEPTGRPVAGRRTHDPPVDIRLCSVSVQGAEPSQGGGLNLWLRC